VKDEVLCYVRLTVSLEFSNPWKGVIISKLMLTLHIIYTCQVNFCIFTPKVGCMHDVTVCFYGLNTRNDYSVVQ